MKTWTWKLDSSRGGMWRFGPRWLKPAVVATPWITVGLLLLMLHMIGGTLTAAEGALFDLPQSGITEGEATQLVALVMVMPNSNEAYIFFDDARYSLGSDISVLAFGEHLSDRVSKTEDKTLLVLADRSVRCDQLGKIAAITRKCGLRRILFANRRTEARAE